MAVFSITLKDPDYGVNELGVDKKAKAVRAMLTKFVEWGEYVTVEFDTEAGTARVVPVKEVNS